ncbi:MAG: hypothetical protein WCS73_01445 [Lentisphaeria bacterium]
MFKFMLSSEEINSNGGFSFIKKLFDGNVRMKDWDAELPSGTQSLLFDIHYLSAAPLAS